MNDTLQPHYIFFEKNALDKSKVKTIVNEALHGMDDGELFLEFCQSESYSFDDGVLKSANFDVDSGFGLRSILGETTGYAHSSMISESSLARASQTVQAIKNGYSGQVNLSSAPANTNLHFYNDLNPLHEFDFSHKTKLLADIDAYLRGKHDYVRQVSASLSGEWQVVHILRADGFEASDIRPLVRINISVTVEKDGRMEQGYYGAGGRQGYTNYIAEDYWKQGADEALRQALVNLESVPAPAGEMPVVLAPGWPGILLHEAVGHGLESDFNRKGTSAFAGLLGKKVASDTVTVVDDGTLDKQRGSLTIDDEGTPTQCTTLIEDGILKGYMHDRMNAHLMGVPTTGNGRRESFAHQPMPRMTNTYMLPGQAAPEDIIASVKDGVYAVNFSGGQVDITSGKFVFSASEAYKIENGKVTQPIKGATLIGNGPDILTKVSMVANDMQLDKGVGTCGKMGQSVPVGNGQPTILVDKLTVGGTG